MFFTGHKAISRTWPSVADLSLPTNLQPIADFKFVSAGEFTHAQHAQEVQFTQPIFPFGNN